MIARLALLHNSAAFISIIAKYYFSVVVHPCWALFHPTEFYQNRSQYLKDNFLRKKILIKSMIGHSL
jgi:hypothetical protein